MDPTYALAFYSLPGDFFTQHFQYFSNMDVIQRNNNKEWVKPLYYIFYWSLPLNTVYTNNPTRHARPANLAEQCLPNTCQTFTKYFFQTKIGHACSDIITYRPVSEVSVSTCLPTCQPSEINNIFIKVSSVLGIIIVRQRCSVDAPWALRRICSPSMLGGISGVVNS